MKSKIFNLHQGKLNTTTDDLTTIDPQLLLVFGERNKIEDKQLVEGSIGNASCGKKFFDLSL